MLYTLRRRGIGALRVRQYLRRSFRTMPSSANLSPITRILAVIIAESTNIEGCSCPARPPLSRLCKALPARFSKMWSGRPAGLCTWSNGSAKRARCRSMNRARKEGS